MPVIAPSSSLTKFSIPIVKLGSCFFWWMDPPDQQFSCFFPETVSRLNGSRGPDRQKYVVSIITCQLPQVSAATWWCTTVACTCAARASDSSRTRAPSCDTSRTPTTRPGITRPLEHLAPDTDNVLLVTLKYFHRTTVLSYISSDVPIIVIFMTVVVVFLLDWHTHFQGKIAATGRIIVKRLQLRSAIVNFFQLLIVVRRLRRCQG